MEFRMHKSDVNVFYPKNINYLVLMNKVEDNMKVFTKRDVKGVKSARKLNAKLLYPLNVYFKWFIKNNQIKNCKVSVRNIYTAIEIWWKYISALKGNTVCGNPTGVASDCINICKEIANLNKTLFLTARIFFVNGIPFFISLSRKIDFIGVIRLKGNTAAIISYAFKSIFRFYLQWGSCIPTVHADGEFGAFKDQFQNIPAGPRVNLTSAN